MVKMPEKPRIVFSIVHSMGMTGFDSVILAWFRFCSGGQRFPHPLLQTISATADVPAVFKKAFANFSLVPAFALAA